jgi:hypothetical protein
MMKCGKCQGRVFIDRVFSQKLHVELFCIMCGKRWMINKDTSPLGRWLEQVEKNKLKDLAISS